MDMILIYRFSILVLGSGEKKEGEGSLTKTVNMENINNRTLPPHAAVLFINSNSNKGAMVEGSDVETKGIL